MISVLTAGGYKRLLCLVVRAWIVLLKWLGSGSLENEATRITGHLSTEKDTHDMKMTLATGIASSC